jgi:parallel beta-helix repeat protein
MKRSSKRFPISNLGLICATAMLAGIAVPAVARDKEMPPSLDSCGSDSGEDSSTCLQRFIDSSKNVALVAGRTYSIGKALIVRSGHNVDGNGAKLVISTHIAGVIVSGSGINIRNLTLIAKTMATDGIYINKDTSDVTIQSNKILGGWREGILFGRSGQRDLKFVSNTIAPFGGLPLAYGILGNPAVLGRDGKPPTNVTIRNNRITNVSSDAIELNSPGRTTISDVDVVGNILSAPNHVTATAGFCIGMAGVKNVRIRENIMFNCRWQGIHVEDGSSNVVIAGNTINKTIGGVGQKNSSGILLLNSNRITIYNNQIRNTWNSGIDLVWNAKGVNSDVSIMGNDIRDAGDFGIRVAGPQGSDSGIVVGATRGYAGNKIINAKVAPFMSCLSAIKGGDARLRTCANR